MMTTQEHLTEGSEDYEHVVRYVPVPGDETRLLRMLFGEKSSTSRGGFALSELFSKAFRYDRILGTPETDFYIIHKGESPYVDGLKQLLIQGGGVRLLMSKFWDMPVQVESAVAKVEYVKMSADPPIKSLEFVYDKGTGKTQRRGT